MLKSGSGSIESTNGRMRREPVPNKHVLFATPRHCADYRGAHARRSLYPIQDNPRETGVHLRMETKIAVWFPVSQTPYAK